MKVRGVKRKEEGMRSKRSKGMRSKRRGGEEQEG